MNNVFFWYDGIIPSADIIDFFLQNISPDYISHSEVQTHRASDFNSWSPNLSVVLELEINKLCSTEILVDELPKIALATLNNRISALAIIKTTNSLHGTFVIIEDFIVRSDIRSNGLGSLFYKWIESQFNPTSYIFLESGIKNINAHSFFRKQGFNICSSIFCKKL
jgi:Acetyltransferase (GNAT) family